jgi:hypothetical protein
MAARAVRKSRVTINRCPKQNSQLNLGSLNVPLLRQRVAPGALQRLACCWFVSRLGSADHRGFAACGLEEVVGRYPSSAFAFRPAGNLLFISDSMKLLVVQAKPLQRLIVTHATSLTARRASSQWARLAISVSSGRSTVSTIVHG